MTTMTRDQAPRRRAETPRTSVLGSGWVPAVLVAVWTAACLVTADVPLGSVVAYGAYAVLGVALPGTLLWRMLVARGRRPWLEDVAIGSILAWAVEIPTYLLARAIGVPRLGLLWVVVVLALAVVLPIRRDLWRPREVTRLPVGVSWTLAALVAGVVGWFTRYVWWPSPLSGGALRYSYVDQPFHLTLIGELRHHVPAQFPYVPDETLQYHWFAHADMAAASWYSGVESIDLLQRLSPLLMVVLTIVATAMVAARLVGSTSWGLVAPVALVLVGTLGYLTSSPSLFVSGLLYLSPTHAFGTVVCALVTALVLRVLGDEQPRATVWVALAMSMMLLAGSKATFVPMVGAAAGAVILIEALRRRRLARSALALLVLSGVVMVLAQLFVYGSGAPGIELKPFGTAQVNLEALQLQPLGEGVGVQALAMIAYLLPRALLVVGGLGLLVRGRWDDPRTVWLLGAVLAATGATYTFVHPDQSQFYFLISALVPAAVATAWGVSELWHAPRAERARRPALVLAGLGLLLGIVVGEIVLDRQPIAWVKGLLPVALVGAVLVLALAWGLVSRHRPGTVLVLVVGLLGLSLSQTFSVGRLLVSDPLPAAYQPVGAAAMGAGGIQTARWLRRNVDPDDRIATNAHCRPSTADPAGCDIRSFSLSAFSERRVLLEGWSYNPRNAARATEMGFEACCTPFWDPKLLAANDAAFDSPSAADVQLLRERYGVRWLVVDTRMDGDWQPLTQVAEERLRKDDYVVFEVPAA